MAPTAVAQADLSRVAKPPVQGRPEAGYRAPGRSQGPPQRGTLVGEQDGQNPGQEAVNSGNAGIAARIDSLNKQLGPLQAQYEKAEKAEPNGPEALRLKREIKRLQAEIEQLFEQIQQDQRREQDQGGQSAAPTAAPAPEANRPGREPVGATPESMRQAIRAQREQEPAGPTAESAKQSVQDWKDGNRPADTRTASIDPASEESPARSKRRKIQTPREAARGPAISPDEQIYRPGEAARQRRQTARATGARVKQTSGEQQVTGTTPQQQR